MQAFLAFLIERKTFANAKVMVISMTLFSAVRRWIVYLLILCGLCAFAINYTGWFASFLFWLALLLPPFSLILTVWPLSVLRLSAEILGDIHRGEEAELQILPKKSKMPLCPYYLPVTITVTQKRYISNTIQKDRRIRSVRYCFVPYLTKSTNRRYCIGGSVRIPLDTAHTAIIRTEIMHAYLSDFLGLFLLPLPRPHAAKAVLLKAPHPGGDIQKKHTPYLSIDTVIHPARTRTQPQKRPRMWSSNHTVLVPTQHPSEQYELRAYRPGDTLRSVHWKLSAKTDALLVRESMEPAFRSMAVTVDRPQDPTEADIVYDALDWLLYQLCVRQHIGVIIVAWINDAGRTCTETIKDFRSLETLYLHILSDGIPKENSAHAFAPVYRMADHGYHLDIASCRNSEEETA